MKTLTLLAALILCGCSRPDNDKLEIWDAIKSQTQLSGRIIHNVEQLSESDRLLIGKFTELRDALKAHRTELDAIKSDIEFLRGEYKWRMHITNQAIMPKAGYIDQSGELRGK